MKYKCHIKKQHLIPDSDAISTQQHMALISNNITKAEIW